MLSMWIAAALAGAPSVEMDGEVVRGTRTRGLLVGGVPVGNADYEMSFMRAKGAEVAAYIDATIDGLRGSPDHLWAVTHLALQQRLVYWLQHVAPERTMAAAEVVDRSLLSAAEACTQAGVFSSDDGSRRVGMMRPSANIRAHRT